MFLYLPNPCASSGGGDEIFVKKKIVSWFWPIPLFEVEKLAPLTKSKLKNIQDDNENKMILNNIPFSRWRSWPHWPNVQRSAPSTWRTTLSSGRKIFFIWSSSSYKVHGWVFPPCWAPWGENFRSSDLLTICATYKKDNSCHLQKNRTIFILNIIQLTDLVFMGNPLEEELSEAEDYNNRVVRSLQMFIWKWLDSGKCCQFTGVQHLPTSEMTMLAKLMMYSDPDMS